MNNYIEIIERRLSELKSESTDLSIFLNKITPLNPIIIGGFIRNAINNEQIRDIDIILNSQDNKEIEKIIVENKLKYKRNSFNGYKIYTGIFTIDIWYIENHNLFKKAVYEPTFSNICETTFINYDSLVYDLNTKKLNINHYLESINSNQISFVGNDQAIKSNGQLLLSIVKIFLISYTKKMVISDEIKDYILKYYSKHPNFIEEIKNEFERHYNYPMDTELENYIHQYVKIKRTK